jgi:hypothetical protein
MKPQATRVTQKQLAYLAYWQDPKNGGYTFDRDAVIPESTEIQPEAWRLPRVVDLAFTAVCLAAIGLILYQEGGFL